MVASIHTNHTVYFLGAGFSIAATEGATPAMKGYFSKLGVNDYPQLYEFIVQSHGNVQDAELQSVISDLDQCEDLPSRRICIKQDIVKLKMDLADYTFDILGKTEWKVESWAPQLLAQATETSSTVITTNYDTIAEEIMSSVEGVVHCGGNETCFHCRMRRLIASCQSCNVEDLPGEMWKNVVIKLHGSLAWYTCRSTSCAYANRTWTSCSCSANKDEVCRICKKKAVGVLMHPRMMKQYSEFRVLQSQWDAASIALSQATQLIMIGFSLPDTDAAIRRLIRTSVDLSKLKSITVITREPKEVAEKIQRLLGENCHATINLYEAPKFGEWPNWLHRQQNGCAVAPVETH